MGKSIVLAYEEMAHKYTSASQIVYIYELSKYGAKDLSHKVFGNIGGENVVLSGDKVYLIGASLADSSSNLIKNCVTSAYSPLWSTQDNGGLQRETFTKILTKRMATPVLNTRWQKDIYSTSAKEFKFNMFNFDGYSNLTTGIVNFVSSPEDMSEEHLHEILDVYGGKEDFDVRQFMFDMEFIEDNLNNEYVNVLKHICTSKSYILPSPLFISNYQVTGMLHLARKMLSSTGVLTTFVKEFYSYRLQNTAEYNLYCCSAGTWGKLIESALNPECLAVELFRTSNRVKSIATKDSEFSSLTKRSSVFWDMLEELLEEGYDRDPVVKKLRQYKSGSLEPELIPIVKVSANLKSQIRKIIDSSSHSKGTLHSALLEASILSANRYANVLNSTTYLCRDMQKTIENSMYTKVRWKGARKEQEKLLASRLYAVGCVFKSPKLVKDLLSSCFLLNCGPFSSLPTFGEFIFSLTDRDNTLRIPTEIAEKSNLLRKLHNVDARYVIYLRDGSDRNYQEVLSSATEVLVQMCNNKRVQDTVEAGIQVVTTQKLLVTEEIIESSHSTGSLHMLDPHLSKNFKVEGDLLKSSTYLEELYYLLKESRERHKEVDIREYVNKVLECIEILNELRSTIALKSLESYYLNGPLVRFLSAQKWTNLLG